MSASRHGSLAGRSVFVTGHTGFKGAWLCLWLERLGARVTGYALAPPTEPSLFREATVAEALAGHHEADVRDYERLAEALDAAQPDLVLHLAAQSVVREAHRAPRETFDINVMGTVNVLEAVRAAGRPCAVVVVTSDKSYLNLEQPWGYREDDPLGDASPYGGSKGAADIVTRAYRTEYFAPARLAEHGVALASARAGNVIGGGDWTADALLPDVVRALAAGGNVRLRHPDAVRPWQHVLDCLDGYLTLAAGLLDGRPELCEAWNFGPLGGDRSVRQLVECFLLEWGGGRWSLARNGPQPREAGTLRLCIDKAMSGLGWSPRWGLDEAVRETARWYRRWLAEPHAARELCREQIGLYEESLEPQEAR